MISCQVPRTQQSDYAHQCERQRTLVPYCLSHWFPMLTLLKTLFRKRPSAFFNRGAYTFTSPTCWGVVRKMCFRRKLRTPRQAKEVSPLPHPECGSAGRGSASPGRWAGSRASPPGCSPQTRCRWTWYSPGGGQRSSEGLLEQHWLSRVLGHGPSYPCHARPWVEPKSLRVDFLYPGGSLPTLCPGS